jgi:murein DD-endopeptidase MepM/ murein hydrolase activator NlpD
MAVAVKPSNSLINIRSSIKSVRSSFSGLKKKTGKLNNILLKKTKVKRESIARNYILSQRRQEAERRKNREDLIEASSIGGVFKMQTKAVASSTKGFLGRIMDFLGTLLVGWLMYNLPSIITMAQELIARMQRLSTIVSGFFNNTVSIFRGFGNVLGAIGKNILTFDFTDSNKRVENAVKGLGNTFDDMQSQFDEGFRLLTTSLGEGIVSGQDADPFGTKFPNQSMQEPSGGLPSKQSPEMYRIAAALSTEGTGSQSSVDMMQVVVNRKASGRYGNNYTDILAAGESVNRSQFQGVWKRPGGPKAFRKIETLEDAAKWSGQSKQSLLKIISDIQNPTLQENASKHVKGALEFRASAVRYPRLSGSAWRGGSGDNQFLLDPSKDPIRGEGSASFNLPAAIQQPTPAKMSPGVSTTVKDELNVATNKSSLGGLTPGQGFGAYRTSRRSHAGIDIGTYGKKGFYVSFKQSGTVTYAQNNSDGYGNLVIIKVGNIEFYFAHLAKIMVKNGQPYNGQTIGEIGKSGGNYDIHLHFEARPGGKAIDPRPYLGLLSIGRELTGTSGQPTTISAPTPVQIASQGTQQRQQVSQQLAQQRNGPTIVVIEEDPPAQQQVSAGGGGEGGMIPIIINPLNSFITKKLLLDLAYT